MTLVIGLSFAMFAFFSRPQAVHTTQAKKPEQISNSIVNKHAPLLSSANSEAVKNGTALHIPILMYHHIGTAPATADATHRGLTISPAEFETQVKWLKDNGYESITLDYMYGQIKNNTDAWPAKPVIFTFDDGYTDVFENAIPILQKYNFVGSFAIITSFPGQTQGDNFYATWTQIAAAKHSGMEIVCHTQNHFDGSSPKFTDDFIYSNLSGCQDDLQLNVGSRLPYLVYPYGHYTPSYVTQAQKAGFVLGLTVQGGSYVNKNDLMHIPRVRVNPNESMEKFAEKLNE